MKPQYPLVFSSLFIRLGIGVMVTQIFVSLIGASPLADWAVAVFAIGAVVVGSLISMIHLGRPNRFFHAFYNISSHLTWEAILTPLLLLSMTVVAVASYVQAGTVLAIGKVCSFLFGVAFIYTMGKVYHLKSRPSWSSPMVVYEFFVSAACMGVLGLAALLSLSPVVSEGLVRSLLIVGSMLLFVEAFITVRYRFFVFSCSATAAEALREKESTIFYYLWMILGIIGPIVVNVIVLLSEQIDPILICSGFASFFLGALFWRILFFKGATPMKITPDIDAEGVGGRGNITVAETT